jgi:hypothetical protein
MSAVSASIIGPFAHGSEEQQEARVDAFSPILVTFSVSITQNLKLLQLLTFVMPLNTFFSPFDLGIATKSGLLFRIKISWSISSVLFIGCLKD